MVTQGPGLTHNTDVSRVDTFKLSLWVGKSDRRVPPWTSMTCLRDFLSNLSSTEDRDLSWAASLSESSGLAGPPVDLVRIKLRPENISRSVELRADPLLFPPLECSFVFSFSFSSSFSSSEVCNNFF